MLLKVKNNGAIKKVVFKPEYQCFETLEAFLINLTQRPSKSFNISYMDDENEEVVIKDQIDLEVYLHFASDRKFLELNINDKSVFDIESDFIEINDITRLLEINKNCESFRIISKELPESKDELVSESTKVENANLTGNSVEAPLKNEIAEESLVRSDPNLLLSIDSEKPLFDNTETIISQEIFELSVANESDLPSPKFKEITNFDEIKLHNQNIPSKNKGLNDTFNERLIIGCKKFQEKIPEYISSDDLNFRKYKKEELPIMKFHCCCCDTESCGFRVVFCLVCAYQLCSKCHEIVVHEHPMIITPITIDNAFIETLKKKYAKLSIQRKFLMKNAKPLADFNKIQKRPDNLRNNDLDNFEQTPETDENLSKVELTNAIANEYLTPEEIESFISANNHLNLEAYLLSLENHLFTVRNK
jgi:hypothetical protein